MKHHLHLLYEAFKQKGFKPVDALTNEQEQHIDALVKFTEGISILIRFNKTSETVYKFESILMIEIDGYAYIYNTCYGDKVYESDMRTKVKEFVLSNKRITRMYISKDLQGNIDLCILTLENKPTSILRHLVGSLTRQQITSNIGKAAAASKTIIGGKNNKALF